MSGHAVTYQDVFIRPTSPCNATYSRYDLTQYLIRLHINSEGTNENWII